MYYHIVNFYWNENYTLFVTLKLITLMRFQDFLFCFDWWCNIMLLGNNNISHKELLGLIKTTKLNWNIYTCFFSFIMVGWFAFELSIKSYTRSEFRGEGGIRLWPRTPCGGKKEGGKKKKTWKWWRKRPRKTCLA